MRLWLLTGRLPEICPICSHGRVQPLFVRIVAEVSSVVKHSGVARGAKRDQVLLQIVAGVATKFLVVDLEI
jgi:hypothetical protein